MDNRIVKYDAFISYRHSEPDSFVAETLHRQLESFKLPKNVARRKIAQVGAAKPEDVIGGETIDSAGAAQGIPVNKTKIQRVFRDKEELPLVTNLADPITEALENSEYLIVICSPRLPESMWCRKEIETFIEMHDREHVLAVLVEGEPDTSFPEELLYREVEETQSDGSVIKTRIPVEPLAADVRGTDRNEMRRKIKSELLRLVAPMFDCNYDDLKQRHKEQRIRKIIMTSVSISAACLLFGIVSTTMALRIQHQNTQIKEQNAQIREQSDEIAAQAQEIEKQYREAKRNTAISRSKEAVAYLEEGDRMRAIATAQDALLDLSDGDGIEEGVDYPAQAVYALTDSLYLYENGQQILPDRILEADTVVRTMKLSPEGSRVLTADASGQIIVWQPGDIQTRIVLDVVYDGITLVEDNKIAFIGEDRVLCPVDDNLVVYDLSGGSAEEAYRVPVSDSLFAYYEGVIVMQETQRAIVLTKEGYRAIDCADGHTLYEEQWDIDGSTADPLFDAVCSEDERYWAVSLELPSDPAGESRKAAAVYDALSGELLNVYPVEYGHVETLRFDEDRFYIVSGRSSETDPVHIVQGMEGRLQAYDIRGGGTPLWTYERRGGWLYDIAFGQGDYGDYLLCAGYSDVAVLNKEDGSYIDIFALGVEVTELWYADAGDSFMAFTRDGVWHYLSLDRMEDMVGMVFPACTSTNVKNFAIGSGYCVTLPYNSRLVTVYKTARGVGTEVFYEGDNSYREAVLSSDGAYLALSYYNSDYTAAIAMLDTGTGERIWNYEDDSRYSGMQYIDYDGQETLAFLTSDKILLLQPETGECLASVPHEIGGFMEYVGYDRNEQWLVLKDNHRLYGLDLNDLTGGCREIEYERSLSYNDIVAMDTSGIDAVADKEANVLRFYRDGKEFYTYGQGQEPSQPDYINFQYMETMFFDEGQETKHLYIVYADGRITVLNIGDDTGAADFCTAQDSEAYSDKYAGIEDLMKGYAYMEGDDYAILKGITDAYLITAADGEILAHLHGFLAYDSAGGQIYLANSGKINRLPLYTLEQINEIAAGVRQDGQW